MKKKHSFFFHIFVFVLAQIAWLFMLGLWIYLYVYNVIILNRLGEVLPKQLISRGMDVFILVGGCILFVAVSIGMSLIFRYLSLHLKLNNLYDTFIANVTHELKSPLASIQLHLETMNMRKVTREKQKEFFALMLKDSDRLKNLVNSILEISGLEHKDLAYNCDIYPTETIVKNLLRESMDQLNLSDDRVEVVGKCPHECVVDKHALRIAFDNLLDNAQKYTMRPFNITVTLGYTKKNVTIRFQDDGIGIGPPDQKRIFKKFHRIYNRDIPNVKGTGLGLYWVREIIKYHGGKIEVSSEGRNRGASFTIHLPIYRIYKTRYLNYLLKIAKRKKELRNEDNG